jgi:hypothetical protein
MSFNTVPYGWSDSNDLGLRYLSTARPCAAGSPGFGPLRWSYAIFCKRTNADFEARLFSTSFECWAVFKRLLGALYPLPPQYFNDALGLFSVVIGYLLHYPSLDRLS